MDVKNSICIVIVLFRLIWQRTEHRLCIRDFKARVIRRARGSDIESRYDYWPSDLSIELLFNIDVFGSKFIFMIEYAQRKLGHKIIVPLYRVSLSLCKFTKIALTTVNCLFLEEEKWFSLIELDFNLIFN